MNIHPVATKDIRACGAPERMEASRLHAQLPFSRKTGSRRRAIRVLISICMSFIRFESRTCQEPQPEPQVSNHNTQLSNPICVDVLLFRCHYLRVCIFSPSYRVVISTGPPPPTGPSTRPAVPGQRPSPQSPSPTIESNLLMNPMHGKRAAR